MKKNTYTLHDRVSYSRIDKDRKLRFASVIDAMQDCALFHSEEVGRSAAALAEINKAWLVNSWHVVFIRRPDMGEYFDVHTWAHKFASVFGHRNFHMETPDHETLAYANSLWFYYDSETNMPVRVPAEESDAYGTEAPYDMDYSVSRKISMPEDLKHVGSIEVNPSHLDSNHHVNNGQYVHLAAGYLPLEYDVGDFRAEYRTAAHYGDTMEVHMAQNDDVTSIIFSDEKMEPYFLSEFRPA